MDDRQILIGKLLVRDAEIEERSKLITKLKLQIAVLAAFPPGLAPSGQ